MLVVLPSGLLGDLDGDEDRGNVWAGDSVEEGEGEGGIA